MDDDPANLRVFEHILQALGAQVTTAPRALEALALMERRSFDLALVDIHMPEMNGIDLVRCLRRRPGPNQATPVIAVTADVYSHSRSDYLELGFDDFLPKPVPVATLLETARRLAGASAWRPTLGELRSA
ncbi:MAG: response regulator [Phenylobacterium sp.]